MGKCKSATCITKPAVTEQTKRIFPLVGQLARAHSWHSCSSLLHPPAINRTLHHSGFKPLLRVKKEVEPTEEITPQINLSVILCFIIGAIRFFAKPISSLFFSRNTRKDG
ncbi:hypothetical protein HanPI659440_Chr11g0415731 [Helianthus annuus]|nr:hypothetical protein HanPI659440_Chr11g0415731 [Helianthus annuus]